MLKLNFIKMHNHGAQSQSTSRLNAHLKRTDFFVFKCKNTKFITIFDSSILHMLNLSLSIDTVGIKTSILDSGSTVELLQGIRFETK